MSAEPGREPTRWRPVVRVVLRVTWVAVKLIAVFCVGQKGDLFFYQGF
jgi:hypothetical protein